MSRPFYTEAQQRRVLQVIPDLIRSRELLVDLVWKDLRVRYRRAVIGYMWAILDPLLMCLVLTFVFTQVFDLRNADPTIKTGKDFAALLLCALIPWQFFSNALTSSIQSVIEYRDLISKAYFPREVVPLSAVGTSTVNFSVAFAILLGLLVAFGRPPGLGILWVFIIIAIQFILVAGLALLLSCLYVHYRDVIRMVNVGIMFGFYATPIFYTLPMVERHFGHGEHWLYYVYMANPMVGLVTAYRQALVYNQAPVAFHLLWPAFLAVLFLLLGVFAFRRRAGTMADFV